MGHVSKPPENFSMKAARAHECWGVLTIAHESGSVGANPLCTEHTCVIGTCAIKCWGFVGTQKGLSNKKVRYMMLITHSNNVAVTFATACNLAIHTSHDTRQYIVQATILMY
jgi:hypothetical protein